MHRIIMVMVALAPFIAAAGSGEDDPPDNPDWTVPEVKACPPPQPGTTCPEEQKLVCNTDLGFLYCEDRKDPRPEVIPPPTDHPQEPEQVP